MKTKAPKIKISEHELQCNAVQWFRLNYPKRVILAIPNGGLRNIRVAMKLKREGVRAGVYDLFVPEPQLGGDNGLYHGFWIELKVGYNKPTKEQQEFMLLMEARGYKTQVCYTLEEFMNCVNNYFK